MSEISVILTVYGLEYNKYMDAVIKSILNQNVNPEVILCEQSLEPSTDFVELSSTYNIKYVHCKPDVIEQSIIYNIGKVRNIAAKNSLGNYLYFTDIDVIMTCNNFLEQLLNFSVKHKTPLIRPFSRRLVIEDVNIFANDYCKGILIDFNNNDYFCYSKYLPDSKSIVPYKKHERYALINNILHVSKFETKPSDFLDNQIEEFSDKWQTAMHFGGIFLSRKQFKNVGGFCELYYNWGCEDIDLQWKLDYSNGIQYADNAIQGCCLMHFEHILRCKNKMYKKNCQTFSARKRDGAIISIENDKNTSIR